MKRPAFFSPLRARAFLNLLVVLIPILTNNPGDAGAAATINVLSPLVQETVAATGAGYTGSILIENPGKTPCTVRIYQTDYLYYAHGANIYGTPGENPSSNARWITLGANWLTIPAGEKAMVHYKVQVPQIINLQGTYWSMVMVEPVDTQPVVEKKTQNAVTLQTKIRYGVQIITNIGNTGTRRIRFLNRKLATEKNRSVLELDIENSGERVLFPLVSLQLFTADGRLLGTFYGKKTRILPTCSIRQKITLPRLSRGKYKALVIVDNEDQYVFGANYELVIEK